MANKVTIDCEGRFIDNITSEAKPASKAIEELGNDAEQAQQKLNKLGKGKTKVDLDAEDSKFTRKLLKAEKKAEKFGRSKAETTLDADDKATSKINKLLSKGKSLAGKAWSMIVKVKDSSALSTINKISSGLKGIASKTWTAVVKVKNIALTPLNKLKNALFSIKGLVAAVTAGLAANKFVLQPIGLADAYSSAKIGFQTLLGNERGQQMMNDLDKFAKATPFKSSEVISQTQRMLAMGWDAENIIKDMTTIGDAAAATGKGEEGLQRIVTALAQIKSKGKLSTEELNQLAEAGISAKRYIAEGLGYGTGDEGIAKMTKDLEKGSIASGKAVEALLAGMKEYNGMMDKTANETVEGLKSQIEDTFEINILRRWGQGLQDGAKRGLGSLVTLLDKSEGALQRVGDMLYEIGVNVSTWAADKLENLVEKINKITKNRDFQDASLGGKIKILWDGLVADPIKEWWEGGGKQKTAQTAGKIGKWIGKTITKGLLAILGATDVLDKGVGEKTGMGVAESFLDGFLSEFDGSAITKAFVDAIGNVWNALPFWAKVLIGGYGAKKIGGGIASVASFLGSASKPAGLLGFGTNAAIAMGGGNLAGGASLGAGALSALGLGATAGLATGAITAISGISEISKGIKNDDSTLKKSGGWKVGGAAGGAALGAAIGSIIPGVGTLIGTGLGALAGSAVGWFKSNKIKKKAEEEAEAIEKAAEAAKKLADENLDKHFGDITLNAKEMSSAIKNIIGEEFYAKMERATEAIDGMNQSITAVNSASSSLHKALWIGYNTSTTGNRKLTDEEQQAIRDEAANFRSSAKVATTDAQFAARESIISIMGDESAEAKWLLDRTDKYYEKQAKKVEDWSKYLNDTLYKALSDGVISIDEQKSIDKIRQQITDITEQLAQDKHTAKMNILEAKYAGDLTPEGFGQLMAGAAEGNAELADSYWEAYGQGSVGLNEAGKKKLLEGTMGQLSDMWTNTGNFGLNTIREQYDKELGILGEDISSIVENNTVPEITAAIEGMAPEVRDNIGTMMEYMAPTTAEARALADKYKNLGMEVPEALQSYLDTAAFYEALAAGPDAINEFFANHKDYEVPVNLEAKVEKIDLMEGFDESETAGKVLRGQKLEEVFTVDANVNTNWTYDEWDEEWISPDKNYSFTTETLVEAGWTYNEFEKEWISPDGMYSFGTKGEVTVEYLNNKFPDNKSQFGIKDSYNKSTTVNLDVNYKISGKVTSNGNPQMDYAAKQALLQAQGGRYRGGIIGGPSAMEAFAMGGRPDDGMLRGSTRYIRVNEEAPEMIIPLSSQRRERGLELWEKTGELLNVPGFARGGLTNGGDEGFRFRGYDGEETTGGQTVQIEVGGITVEIHVDATGHENVAEAIREQSEEIAETVAGILADAFAGQFENTPLRKGA